MSTTILERLDHEATRAAACTKLIRLIQREYSGELAASIAYRGHWRTLLDAEERRQVRQIESDELHHRERLGGLLHQLGSAPDQKLERAMRRIGHLISMLTRLAALIPAFGWYIAMYGAGRLERGNIDAYEYSARLALTAGYPEVAQEMLAFAECEWDHDHYFRTKCQHHWLRRIFPIWRATSPRECIRRRWQQLSKHFME